MPKGPLGGPRPLADSSYRVSYRMRGTFDVRQGRRPSITERLRNIAGVEEGIAVSVDFQKEPMGIDLVVVNIDLRIRVTKEQMEEFVSASKTMLLNTQDLMPGAEVDPNTIDAEEIVIEPV